MVVPPARRRIQLLPAANQDILIKVYPNLPARLIKDCHSLRDNPIKDCLDSRHSLTRVSLGDRRVRRTQSPVHRAQAVLRVR